MIELSNCVLSEVSAHLVGNKTTTEEIHLTKEPLDISDQKLRELLVRFFLTNFKSPEYFSFTFSNEDIDLNPVYNYVSEIFDNPDALHSQSVNLAKHLFETSVHPNIKSGDFFVAYFPSLIINHEKNQAIGLFKSENKDSFIKLISTSNKYKISYDNGISIDKLDKGCLILDIQKESGYKICIFDKSNKSTEAQYWREHFLNLTPCADNYHHTKNFLTLTKNFVTDKLNQEFETTKADQIDLLNRSMDYFKKHEQFEENEFTKEIFKQNDVIESFKHYKNDYQDERSLEIADGFEISDPALKKQSRIYKSVLKLDKNFHIYIHGNPEMIEKGMDSNGRKFYKIYYNEEA